MITPAQLQTLRDALPASAVSTIATETGKSKSHIRKVLSGERSENAEILRIAARIANEQRNALLETKEIINQL